MAAPSRGNCLWIVSDDEAFRRRAQNELVSRGCQHRLVTNLPLDTPGYWNSCERVPGVLLLDAGPNVDWATRVIRALRRARVSSPVIVTMTEPTREFGTKIVSLGVSYLLPRDFAPGELADVFESLLQRRRGENSGNSNDSNPS